MIQQYINSGILETYVLGIASEEEVKELLRMKAAHPEVDDALKQLELDMERIAGYMAINPPPDTWNKIEQQINEIALREDRSPEKYVSPVYGDNGQQKSGNDYIEVDSSSSHMRIRKEWRWVFAAVFILGKIFLGFAIYFYLENRQAQLQIQELKTEMRQLKK